ncbi:nitrogenase-stabilizing/protective protein nifW [Burkholderiales bacterium GJ-E10]|nr:nitrogenase-stabilizing/protective protein nifW [Burkholderiales bacterium GJ-E10]
MNVGTDTLEKRLAGLSAAEEFLEFFGIAYDEAVVHVNRLHILKRWHQYIERERQQIEGLPEDPARSRYRSLLQRAYDDFVVSSPAAEKVFKVFQDADGQHFSLTKLSSTLPSRTNAPPVR